MTDLDYLREAAARSQWESDDPSTQNGALLRFPHGRDYIMGFNTFPKGVRRVTERPAKYRRIEHAERAVIYRAAAIGIQTKGAVLYCPWFSCPDCARAIAMAGVREVVGSTRAREATPVRWQDLVEDGEAILREAGVSMRWLADPLGVTVLFDGEPLEL